MMSLNKLDDLIERVVERNYAKCVERGATPYRIVGEGKVVEVYDALDGSWGVLEAFPSKAALQRWERAKATREAFVPANGLAHLGQRPFSARVVRLERAAGADVEFVVKEAPGWRHVATIRAGELAAGIRDLADDDETIIDTNPADLRRMLLATATLCGKRGEVWMPDMGDGEDGGRETGDGGRESGVNAEAQRRGDAEAGERSDTSRSTGGIGAVMMIGVGGLTEHPKALAFWPDGESRREDVESVCRSVADVRGVREPLVVSPRAEGGWWVIDGCTRLAAARQAGLASVPCLALEVDEGDIADEVYLRNMSRTRFGTGMRIMRYLEMHQEAVIIAAKTNADPSARGAMGGRGNKADTKSFAFSSRALAERLHISLPDVQAGIELLRCRADGMIADVADGKRALRAATDEERAGVEEAYRRVLDGTPPRRWLPAAKGHATTNDKAKADPQWYFVAKRACVSLENAFAHLNEMTDEDRGKILGQWIKTAAAVGKILAKLGTEA